MSTGRRWQDVKAEAHRRNPDLADPQRQAKARAELDGHHLLIAMPDVFPWVRHLGVEEVGAFARELVEALSGVAEPDPDVSVDEVVAGWRATARIKADPRQYEDAVRPTSGDFGPVTGAARGRE